MYFDQLADKTTMEYKGGETKDEELARKEKNLDTLLKTLKTYGPRHIAKALASNQLIRRVRLDNFNLKDDGATRILSYKKICHKFINFHPK